MESLSVYPPRVTLPAQVTVPRPEQPAAMANPTHQKNKGGNRKERLLFVVPWLPRTKEKGQRKKGGRPSSFVLHLLSLPCRFADPLRSRGKQAPCLQPCTPP